MPKNGSVPALSNELVIETVGVSQLKPNPQNARTHSKAQISKIGRSIGRYGQVTPIVCDAEFNVIGGHAILEAIKLRGGETALVTRHSNLSTADKKALGLALNRIGLDAGWDRQVLATNLCELAEAEFEIEDTGFDVAEVDVLLEEHRLNEEYASSAEDDVPAAAFDQLPISRAGDVWKVGRHKLAVGDAREPETYRALLGDERASMSIADPL